MSLNFLVLVSGHYVCNIQLIPRVNVQVITMSGPYILSSAQPYSLYFLVLLSLKVCPGDQLSPRLAYLLFCEPIITLETKLTMALAGCSGSCSANRWHTLSVEVPVFLATKPKILQRWSKALNSGAVIRLKQATSLKITALTLLW